MTETTMQTDCAQMGATVEAHKKLEPFAGTFRAQVKMWMGPGDPMVSTGVMTNTLILGDRFLEQKYAGDESDGPFPNFEGRGYWGYNTVTKRYEGLWIDTASTIMQIEKGDVDSAGKVWTMKGELPDPKTGKPMQKRSVITLRDNDRHTMQMYFTGPDGKESKCMEIEYTRKS